ncbi:MAG: hypothetical protein ACOCV2_02540 [Persicimonas sp.]
MLNRVHQGHDRAAGLFAAATGPQTIELWHLDRASQGEVEQRRADAKLATRRSAIRGLCVASPEHLVTVHATGAVVGWKLPEEFDDETLQAEPMWEESLAFDISLVETCPLDDDETVGLAVGGKAGQLAIARVDADGAELTIVDDAHEGDITTLAFSKEGRWLASGARDRLVKLWEIDSSQKTAATTLHGCEAWPLCAAFSADGRRLVCGCMDNGVYLWDLEKDGDDPLLAVAFHHHGWVVDVAWAPDDAFVASASWDNTIGIFEGDQLTPTLSYEYHRDYVSSLLFVDESPHLISAGYDHSLCVWNYREERLEKMLRAHDDWVLGLAQLDHETLVSISSDKTARLWSRDEFHCVDILGESVSSGFELGADSGLIAYIDDDAERAALEGRTEDEEPGGVRVERPDEATPAVRRVRRAAGPASEGAAKTPMRILDEAVEETLGDALSEGADSAAERLDEDQKEAEDDATERLDDALEAASEAPDPSLDVPDETELDSDFAPETEDSSEISLENELNSDNTALDEAPSDAELDAPKQPDGGEASSKSVDSIDVLDDGDELLETEEGRQILEDFVANAPEDLGLDAISSTGSSDLKATSSSPLDELSEDQLGEFSSMGASSDEDAEPDENPFDSSPQTQPLAEERVEEAVASDRESSSPSETTASEGGDGEDTDEDAEASDEGSDLDDPDPDDDPALAAQKERLREGLLKLKAKARSNKEREAANESDRAPEPVDEGREVPTSRVDLEIDDDVASAIEGLVPEPDEPSPPSLRPPDEPENQLEEESEAPPGGEEEPVDPAYGNQTQTGMLSNDEVADSTSTSGRLTPGESDADDLQVPEVDDEENLSNPGEGSQEDEAGDGSEAELEVIDADLSELWEQRSPHSAPGMGIVKRPLSADTPYELQLRIDAPHKRTWGLDLHAPTSRLVSCGEDDTVIVWDFDGEQLYRLEVPEEGIHDARFHPDGGLVIAGGEDRRVHLWLLPDEAASPPTTVRHATLDGHDGSVTSVSVSDNGKVLMSGSFDGSARAWHLEDGELGARLDGHDGSVTDVGFSGKRLITVGRDGTLRVWDARGLQLDQLQGFGQLLSLSCRKNSYAWTSDDGRAFVYRTSEGTCELVPHDGEAPAIDLRPDGSVASAGVDGRVHLYAPGQKEPFQTLDPGDSIWSLSRAEDYLAVGTEQGSIYVYRRG